MEQRVKAALESRVLWCMARVLLVVVFAASGLAKVIDFEGGVAEMQRAGLEPAVFYNIAVAAVMLVCSALIVLDRLVWLAAGALSVFLLLTIVIAHHFWSLPEPSAKFALFFALEHISLVGGLIAAAIAGHFHAAFRKW